MLCDSHVTCSVCICHSVAKIQLVASLREELRCGSTISYSAVEITRCVKNENIYFLIYNTLFLLKTALSFTTLFMHEMLLNICNFSAAV